MAGLPGLNASYVADMVSCAKAAATGSRAEEEDEDKERPRDNARRDAWP